jgi:hypothetical protein
MATWIHLGWWYFRPSCARQPPFTLSTPSSRVTSAPNPLPCKVMYSYLYSPSSPLCHSLCCHNFSGFLAGRETREGWPLLTVERTNEKGFFLGWLVGLVVLVQEIFCSALAALVGPVQNIFFPHLTLFQFLCLHRPASWAGSRAGSPVS